MGEGASHRLPAKRRAALLGILRERGAALISELASDLGASESTVRRDLDELSAKGELRRTHGGAVLPSGGGRTAFETHFADRSRLNLREKERIGRYAAGLLEPGQSVIFDSSSTVMSAAKALVERHIPLTAVTNDVSLAAALTSGREVRGRVPGGEIRDGSFTLLGPVVQDFLSRLHVDIALMGIHAVTGGSLSEGGLAVAEAKRSLIGAAKRVVLLADHSKFGPPAFLEVTSLAEVDDLITDEDTPKSALDAARESASTRIHVV